MTFGSFGKSIVMLVRHSGHKHADAPNAPRLLRVRGKRPRSYRAAEQRDELAPPHGFARRPENRRLSRCSRFAGAEVLKKDVGQHPDLARW